MYYFVDTDDCIVVINRLEINEDALSGRTIQISSKTDCHVIDIDTHDILDGAYPVNYFTDRTSNTVLVPAGYYGRYLMKNKVTETKKTEPTPLIIDLNNISKGILTLPKSGKSNLPREFSGTTPKSAF
ncbi:hypothetical protein KAR91_39485 [Candidatus Pacearchaeota archaeon]|nr:hypothetical protein [Candidatus Pacearchaeota archaeon]